MYGQLSPEQREVVAAFVRGKRVIDLGCGNCALTNVLIETCGAEHVIALDYKMPPREDVPKIAFVNSLFEDYDSEVPEVALLSWPVNRPLPALLRLVEQAETVIYLGKNTDGTSCGWRGLYEHFSGRAVLRHLPDRRNTLTVYGWPEADRPLTGEETAAIHHAVTRFVTYNRAESIAAERTSVVERP